MKNLVKTFPKSSFLRGASVYLFSNIISAAVPFLLLPVLTRYLTPEEYGEIAMFQVLVGVFSAFVGVNVNGAIVRYYYNNKDTSNSDISSYIGVSIIILLISIIIVSSVLFFSTEYISSLINLSDKYIYMAVLVSAFTFLMKIRLSQYQIRELPLKYSYIQVSNTSLSVIITLVLTIEYSYGSDGRINGLLISSIIVGGISIYLLVKEKLLSFNHLNKENFQDALSYGVKIIPHILGIFLLSTIDRFVIGSNIGLSEAGVYMSAAQLAMVLSIVFDGINKAYVPWLFSILKRDDDIEKVKVVKLTYIYIISLVIMMPFLFYLSPYIVKIILGDEFSGAANIIGLMLVAQCFSGIYLMFTNYIIYEKKTGKLSLVTIFCGGGHVFLSMLLIGNHGIYGVALSLLIIMFFRALITFYIASKCCNIKWY